MNFSTRHAHLALATCLVVSGALAAGATWESEAPKARVMTLGADMEKHDLSSLADGETREFGGGDHRISAQRVGDVVTITTIKGAGEGQSPIQCNVKTETCLVMTGAEGAGHKMIVIKKSGDGDATQEVEKRVSVFVGNGGEGQATWVEGEGGDNSFAFVTSDSDEPMVVEVGMGDKVMLRCPEGDTSMTVDKSEATTEYRCPKHNVALAKVDAPMRHVIRREIRRTSDDKKE